MQYEIERKARVADVAGLRAALVARCGPPVRHVSKDDRYFIEAGVDLASPAAMKSRVVRIRLTGDGAACATAKRRTLVGATEVNREIEFPVGDAAAFAEFLVDYLGFEPLVAKHKTTEAYQAGPLLAELSEVAGLGWFLEVEYLAAAPGEQARAVALIDEMFAACAPHLGPVEARQYIVLLLEREGRIPPRGSGFAE